MRVDAYGCAGPRGLCSDEGVSGELGQVRRSREDWDESAPDEDRSPATCGHADDIRHGGVDAVVVRLAEGVWAVVAVELDKALGTRPIPAKSHPRTHLRGAGAEAGAHRSALVDTGDGDRPTADPWTARDVRWLRQYQLGPTAQRRAHRGGMWHRPGRRITPEPKHDQPMAPVIWPKRHAQNRPSAHPLGRRLT